MQSALKVSRQTTKVGLAPEGLFYILKAAYFETVSEFNICALFLEGSNSVLLLRTLHSVMSFPSYFA